MKVELKLKFEHMKVLQEFSSFAKVAALALGGGDDQQQEDATPANAMDAQMQFAALMGGM
ncbi:hypothetical protein [Telmatospirillum sp.]|uniref:hypothetical protein n=1 Tax=Telmatospirillum sp. TaxID=2079197 RepID=UPI002840B06C|nr:hypothetical protein [Telmatospirillum sp.]MDR3436436.1 hypothetical protein [Telmatospirillum sp.]